MAIRAPVSMPTISELSSSFERSLLAENRAAKTIKSYMEALCQLDAFMKAQGMPRDASNIRREHIQSYIADRTSIRLASTYGSQARM